MPNQISQHEIYQSFSMLHPDGQFMCHCSAKKAQWYIERDLAYLIDEKTFQLKFEPQGKGKAHIAYYAQPLENKCVVCGSHQDLNKHHVVPYVFRSRFPEAYKRSNHHDVLVVCTDCHEKYESYATQYKQHWAKIYHTDINVKLTIEQKHNRKILQAQKLLFKIQNEEIKDKNGFSVVMPEEKIFELNALANQKLYEIDEYNGASWADIIMKNILKDNQLEEFVQKWRQHFLDIMHPQYLPQHWSVEHPLERADKISD